jgi:hypothetical protein
MMGQGAGAKDQMDRAVKIAETAISRAYWEACDAAQAAVDPAELTSVTWVREYLAEAYEIALAIEDNPEPWGVALRAFLKAN